MKNELKFIYEQNEINSSIKRVETFRIAGLID